MLDESARHASSFFLIPNRSLSSPLSTFGLLITTICTANTSVRHDCDFSPTQTAAAQSMTVSDVGANPPTAAPAQNAIAIGKIILLPRFTVMLSTLFRPTGLVLTYYIHRVKIV